MNLGQQLKANTKRSTVRQQWLDARKEESDRSYALFLRRVRKDIMVNGHGSPLSYSHVEVFTFMSENYSFRKQSHIKDLLNSELLPSEMDDWRKFFKKHGLYFYRTGYPCGEYKIIPFKWRHYIPNWIRAVFRALFC